MIDRRSKISSSQRQVMERTDPHRPESIAVAAEESAVQQVEVRQEPGENIEWVRLMEEALTMPGSLSSVYSRFYNYSFFNQILLYSQGVLEPVNTYGRWQAMGRQVQKGSKAKSILRPIFMKVRSDETGELEQKVKGFKMVKCLFGASETEGDPLPEYEPKEWDSKQAMGALAIRQIPFTLLDGSTQGFSTGREVAINPVAEYPLKTLLHEMGHIVLGHTSTEGLEQYQTHRGVMEFGAESTAYLVMNDIGGNDEMDAAGSRGYIQTWLSGLKPTDEQIKGVFKATDQILKAGRTDLSTRIEP